MRCSNCGMPLSPEKTSGTCPRCSAPIGSKPLSNNVPAPAWSPPQTNQNYDWGMGQAQREAQSAGWPSGPVVQRGPSGGSGDTPSPTPRLQPLEAQNQAWFPAQISMQTPAQMPAQMPPQNSMPRMQTIAPSSTPTPVWIIPPGGPVQPGSYAGKAGSKRRGGQLGFTIAGICIITGALLLIFVYIISMELSHNPATAGTSTPAVVQPTSAPHVQPTATMPPAASPSPAAFPGQQYITNAQMASQINTNTAQPLQTATTFKVGSAVYVTFVVHPAGQAGQVCLSWYLNGKFTSNFSFAVGSSDTTAYSYTYYHASGSAYVELSWTNTDCASALLAQRVNFTVQN